MFGDIKGKRVKVTVVFNESQSKECGSKTIEGIVTNTLPMITIDNKYMLNMQYISIIEIME